MYLFGVRVWVRGVFLCSSFHSTLPLGKVRDHQAVPNGALTNLLVNKQGRSGVEQAGRLESEPSSFAVKETCSPIREKCGLNSQISGGQI